MLLPISSGVARSSLVTLVKSSQAETLLHPSGNDRDVLEAVPSTQACLDQLHSCDPSTQACLAQLHSCDPSTQTCLAQLHSCDPKSNSR